MPLTTAVVGAGPAGLLFCIIARIRKTQDESLTEPWHLRLYDKRETYARSHRLRIDPAPYERLQESLRDARFDEVIAFLRAHRFAPEVNALEATLDALLAGLGVKKERLTIGAGAGEVSLAALKEKLEAEGVLAAGGLLTIVGADSVHSAVRSLVGGTPPKRQTHQRIARLRVDGADLPERLGLVSQVQFSKVLGSLVDYRKNRNGYAEVDLFLTDEEHEAVGSLGASPREPVRVSAQKLSAIRAPLFRAVVAHLEREHGVGGPCEVRLTSTFLLEHQVQPRLAFDARELGDGGGGEGQGRATVFLVGDAGVSLPFFRGMACLVQCADALARAHLDLLRDRAKAARIARRYEEEAHAIAGAELAVVRSRARLIRVLREGGRLSALLPFPIQGWLLRAPDLDPSADRSTGWLWLNLALATGAAACTLLAGVYAPGWVRWPSVALEIGGGVAYHAALSFDRGPHRWVRRVWEVQIAALFGAGVLLTPWARWASGDVGGIVGAVAALWWLVLSVAFVAGLYGFEALVSRAVAHAALGREG
jgi:hypothetical protein